MPLRLRIASCPGVAEDAGAHALSFPTMKPVLCLGSLNIDYTYRVAHLVRPGETVAASEIVRGAGGKGLNQSVALARAGAMVSHVGGIGADGHWLREVLAEAGANVHGVATLETGTGHAIIQVAETGENAIVLFPGANQAIGSKQVAEAVGQMEPSGFFLTQNETNGVPEALRLAKAHGLRVVFNPAPMTARVRTYPLEAVDYLIANETEAEALSGEKDWQGAARQLAHRYPQAVVVVTAGVAGAVAWAGGHSLAVPAVRVQAVDTTGAGDVFVGYFVAGVARGLALPEALRLAASAAALSVTRWGAAASVPWAAEVEDFRAEMGV